MNSTLLCSTCKLIVDAVVADAAIANASIGDLSAIADAACHAVLVLVGVALKECDVITKSVGDVVQWAAQGISRSAICQRLGLC
jgi:hypothetical protein